MSSLYNILQHAHSINRWLVLLFLISAIYMAWYRWRGKFPYDARTQRIVNVAFMLVNLQFVVGLVLYFISPYVQFSGDVMGVKITRFYTVEHILIMVIAVALISVGHARAKKLGEAVEANKKVFTFYLIGLVLILLGIPWPFRDLGAAWW